MAEEMNVKDINEPEEHQQPEEQEETEIYRELLKRRSDFMCRVKYTNTLPDVPNDLKFIKCCNNLSRYAPYRNTSLEHEYRYTDHSGHDLMPFDLIYNTAPVKKSSSAYSLHPDDAILLQDEPSTSTNVSRSVQHAKKVSWLKSTEYVSTDPIRFQTRTTGNVEREVSLHLKNTRHEQYMSLMTHDAQLAAIERTFKDSLIPITEHPTKPDVHAVHVLPIFPDFEHWQFHHGIAVFDGAPTRMGEQVPLSEPEMSHSIFQSARDEMGRDYVKYFTPTERSLFKLREAELFGSEPSKYDRFEFKMVREYGSTLILRPDPKLSDQYCFTARNDGLYYNIIEAKINLRKRIAKSGDRFCQGSPLIVGYRPWNERECQEAKLKLSELEPLSKEGGKSK